MTSQQIRFDADLIRRYDRAGPRYTSYPTAVQVTDKFGLNEYKAAALASNQDPIPRPLSLYVHIPFCSSPCFYCGCTKVITRNHEKAEAYLYRLHREIELQGQLYDRDREVEQLHFGGGTPTFLTSLEIERLIEKLGQHFRLSQLEDVLRRLALVLAEERTHLRRDDAIGPQGVVEPRLQRPAAPAPMRP